MHNSNTSTFQPMGFGELLDTTFSLYRKHFRLFIGIIALRFCGELMEYWLGRFLPDFFLKEIVVDLVDVLFALVSMGGIIVITSTIYLDRHITPSDALRQTGHRFWHVLVCALAWSLAFDISRTSILFTIFSVINPISPWAPGSPVTLVTNPLLESPFVFVFISLVSLPFSIYLQTPWWHIATDLPFFSIISESLWMQFIPLAVVPFSIYFAVRWTFAATTVLLERSSIRSAFEGSSELTRGRWWRVWGLLISFSVLMLALQYIVQITVGCILVLAKLTDVTDPMDVVRWVVRIKFFINADMQFYKVIGWTASVVRTLVFPIWVIGITLLYFGLRVRKFGSAHSDYCS